MFHRLIFLFVCLTVSVGTAFANGSASRATKPETALQAIFRDIEENRFDAALQHTEALLKEYPKFRLAHLIKGDLLLARAKPLAGFGAIDGVERQQIEDLREEAIARLRAYEDRPPENYVPRYLLQMSQDQRNAIVVDTKRARIYVYQNDNGKPRFVADFYASHGKAGADKKIEGDNRTPLGVYHITTFISSAKLPDMYGSGAFPINYPNHLDKRLGRTGYGIWLHGSPSDTYSRPPKASEGCVVLANQDFLDLANFVDPGLTPVIISNDIEWLSLDDWQAQRNSLIQAIESWRTDWESTNVDRYLSHYDKQFFSDKLDYTGWVTHKRRVGAGRGKAQISVSQLSMFRNPGADELVVVTFEQTFKSNSHSDTMRKRQYWKRNEDGQWKIVFEGAA